MSKITIIGGDLIEEVGGSYKIYAKGGYEITSGKEIIFNAKGGIKYGTALSPPPPEVEAKCIVHFRPKNWKGEYGFCWFREKNKEISDSEEYDKMVGKYYQFKDSELLEEKPEKFQKILETYYTSDDRADFPDKDTTDTYLRFYIGDDNKWYKYRQKVIKSKDNTEEYEKTASETIHNFKKDPQYRDTNNSLQRLKDEYSSFQYPRKGKKDSVETVVYHGSYIALFPQTANYGKSEADIDMKISFLEEKKPDYLVFKVDGQPLKTDNSFIGIQQVKNEKSKNQEAAAQGGIIKIENPKEKETIKISCKTAENFTTDKKIEVYSVQIKEDKTEIETLAGCITMIAPVIRNINIAIVGVKSKITDDVSSKQVFGRPVDNWLIFFRKALGQALIKVNIIDKQNSKFIELDISNTPKFSATFGVTDGIITKTGGLKRLLDKKFTEDYSSISDTHFKLYFLDVGCGEPGEEGGRTLGFSNYGATSGVMFDGHNEATIAHECLHAMGLPHSFFHRNTSYVFKAMETNNIMDYSHMKVDPATKSEHTSKARYYIWKWQWEIVRGYSLLI
ncbi:hypothetical protein ELOC111193_18260 [Elizabethkingia occulta]|uniref:Uncharacterized protein n=1 Tax=Elizabethkingia occulta TaxID=1867263 RepID=A0A1T3MNR4_9FLAO|nr:MULTISPECIES: hypothetical protein [Weeksellaceae]OPC65920.1 hypothetical protein BAZ10_01400 [Elizabethkingia occulta]